MIVVGLLLAALAAGCGGGGDNGSTAATGNETTAGTGAGGKEGESLSAGGSPSADESGSGGESSSGGAGGESGNGGGSGSESRGGESPGAAESPGAPAPKAESTSAESKADFIVKTNALCAKRLQQIQTDVREIFESAKGEGSQQAALLKLVDDAIAPGLEAEADELGALEPPQGDAGKIEEIVAAIEAAVAEARKDPQAFLTNSTAALAKPQQLARAYGIGSCGRAS